MSIRKFRAGRISTVTASTHVGQFGDVFYDESTGQFRVSDGHTPGGTVVATALNLANGTADVFVNNLTVKGTNQTINNIVSNNETTVTGVLSVTGNASFVGDTTFTGPVAHTGDTVFIGNVTEVGNLVITGQATNNGPSIFNGHMDINGDTTIDGNIVMTGNSSITGNTFVTGPTTVTGNVTITGNSVQTGIGKYIVSTDSLNYGALEITGNVQGLEQAPVVPGVMLHITGQDNGTTPGRAYIDSNRQYSILVGRRFNGTIANPTQAVAGDEVFRLAGTGYPTGGWPVTGLAQIRFIADENQTQTNRGGHLDFLTVPIGSNVMTQVMSVSATTGVTVAGNLTATNVIANTVGTLTGNVNGTIMTAYQPNITSVGTLANLTVDGAGNGTGLTVQGNLRYDIAYGNATATQLTDKSTAVTCNGRTGQITTAPSSIAKGSAVTFTVNNSYVTAVTDLPIVAFQGGATTNSYAVSVTRVQVGSFNITISNNGTGPLTDTIVINFAVMKIS